MELVEVSPPYDESEITALMGTRVIVDVLGSLVSNGNFGKQVHIDKPVTSRWATIAATRWQALDHARQEERLMPHDHRHSHGHSSHTRGPRPPA